MYPSRDILCIRIYVYHILPSLFITQTIDKKWNHPKCPATDDWIKKIWYIYTMEYYSAIKRTKSSHSHQHGWTLRVLC
uniref:Uncharacterized protein n=1 Tax=Equus asinus TaxID=9793 RepID=A0A9L0KH57_EQUAS